MLTKFKPQNEEIEKFYNIQPIKTYGKFLNAIMGGRSIGKSFTVKKDCLYNFKNKGEQFFYLRRTKDNIAQQKGALTELLKDEKVREDFKDRKFGVKGGKSLMEFTLDGITCGYAMPLTTAINIKSTDFPDVTTLIFDEFIPLKGDFMGYLPNEVESFLNLCSTLIRTKENFKIYMLSNTQNIVNPYFSYFNISILGEPGFYTFKGSPSDSQELKESLSEIVVEICKSKDMYTKGKEGKKIPFEKLIAPTPYAQFDVGGFPNTSDFIKSKTPKSVYVCTLFYEGTYYGVWVDYEEGFLIVDKYHVNTQYPKCYTLGKARSENMALSKLWRKYPSLTAVIKAYREGFLFFSDENTKQLLSYILSRF